MAASRVGLDEGQYRDNLSAGLKWCTACLTCNKKRGNRLHPPLIPLRLLAYPALYRGLVATVVRLIPPTKPLIV